MHICKKDPVKLPIEPAGSSGPQSYFNVGPLQIKV